VYKTREEPTVWAFIPPWTSFQVSLSRPMLPETKTFREVNNLFFLIVVLCVSFCYVPYHWL
jgi:hypothetical protein